MPEGLRHRDPPLWRGEGWWRTPRRGGHLNSPAAPAPGRGVPINTDSPERAASPASACRPFGALGLNRRSYPGLAPPGYSNGLPFGASLQRRERSAAAWLAPSLGAPKYVIEFTVRPTKVVAKSPQPVRRQPMNRGGDHE